MNWRKHELMNWWIGWIEGVIDWYKRIEDQLKRLKWFNQAKAMISLIKWMKTYDCMNVIIEQFNMGESYEILYVKIFTIKDNSI